MNKQYKSMADKLAKAGRFGDDRILHVSQAEIEGLGAMLPSGKLPTNPETGQPEAFAFLIPLLIGAGIGGISGGVTAKQKNIPLWQGILQGAAIGGATSVATAGIGAALGGGAGAGSSAATAGVKGVDETLAIGIEKAGEKIINESASSLAAGAPSSTTSSSATDAMFATAIDTVPAVADPSAAGTAISAAPQPGMFSPSELMGSIAGGPSPAAAIADAPGIDPSTRLPDVDASGMQIESNAPVMPKPPVQSFVDTQFGEAARASAKDMYKQPLNIMAPIMMTEALLPTEWDEEDYLSGYSGPYEKSWTTGPGVSWAARDGGRVSSDKSKRDLEKKDSDYLSVMSRLKRIVDVVDRAANPRLPSSMNPLGDYPVKVKVRPSLSGSGTHRIGVTFPFKEGGLASLRRY